MELLASIGADRESWGQIVGLINHGDWEKVILVKNESAMDFPRVEGVHEILIDTKKPLADIKAELVNRLKNEISGFDVCVSIASGTGKEHMAIISALLTIPTGIRLVAFTKKGVEFIN